VIRVRQQRQRDRLSGRELLQERRQEHVPALALLPLENLRMNRNLAMRADERDFSDKGSFALYARSSDLQSMDSMRALHAP
jgi:hypothetical protein